jgi:hypothetical protein
MGAIFVSGMARKGPLLPRGTVDSPSSQHHRRLYSVHAFVAYAEAALVPYLIFTSHARDQMRERQIPEEAVYHVAGDAHVIVERDDGCAEYTGVWAERTIFVVLCGDAEPYRVRTVIDRTRRRGR